MYSFHWRDIADSHTRAISAGCTFHFAAYTSELAAVPIDDWVEEDPVNDSDGPARLKSIIPIKSSSVDSFRLQLHAEV